MKHLVQVRYVFRAQIFVDGKIFICCMHWVLKSFLLLWVCWDLSTLHVNENPDENKDEI